MVREETAAGEPEVVNPMTAFLVAMQFLTVFPPVIRRAFTPQELGRAVGFFPLVGLLLGGVLASAYTILSWLFPPALSSALTLALWIFLTGALHLDGFLDACDGLFGGFTPESRLEIMRDERVGAFALAGGVMLLLSEFSALAASPLPALSLLLAPTLGRLAISLAVPAFPYARPNGLGQAMKQQTTWRQAGLAFLLAAGTVVAGAAITGRWLSAGIALAGVIPLVYAGARFVLGRIPGLTGDIYGALCILTELYVLLVLAAALPA